MNSIKKKIIYFSFSLLIFSLFIFIFDIFIDERFYNNNFYYKSNILDLYAEAIHIQLLKSFFEYHIFFDISFSLLLVNLIFTKIKYLINKQKYLYHIKIIWIFKIILIFTVVAIYEKSQLLDQNIYFFSALNNFETLEFLDFKNKFIPESMFGSYVIMIFIVKILNLFFFNSWFAIKVFISFLYLVVLVNLFKTVSLFSKKNSIFNLYFISLLPSLIYSSSLYTKDIFVVTFITFLFYNISLFLKKKKINKKKILINILVSLIAISLIRVWIGLACFFSITIFYILFNLKTLRNYLVKIKLNYTKYIVIASTFYFLIFYIIDASFIFRHYLQFQIADSYRGFVNIYEFNNGLNLFNEIENFSDFFVKIPVLYFYTLFNPFLEKIFNIKYIILIIENIIILVLILISFYNYFTKDLKTKIFILSIMAYIFIYLNIHLFINYMNIGTGFRYSLQAKIPIIIICLILNDKTIQHLLSIFFKNFQIKRIKNNTYGKGKTNE